MKITNKEEFEKQNVFGMGNANTAYAQYFTGRILFKSADKAGYRLIDTAQAYGNERGVGEGIRTGGVQREELLVVSKVAAGHKTYEDKCRGFPVYDGKI